MDYIVFLFLISKSACNWIWLCWFIDCYCDNWFWDMHTSPVALVCC